MMIPVVIGVSLLAFMILRMTPGDPVRAVAGSEANGATVAQVREELGLNKPALQQYVNCMVGMLYGDMGNSYTIGKPVFSEIPSRTPITFVLAFAGALVTVLIGIPPGIISAIKQYSMLDSISILLALTGVVMPNSWLGLMLTPIFTLRPGWLPSGSVTSWQDYILPVVTLDVGVTANFTCITRLSMLGVIRQDYIHTVRAKGVNEKRVILCYALRNALIPVIMVIGL